MKTFSYDELDRLMGEILPERAVLSTMAMPLDGDSYNNAGGGHHGDHGNDGTTAVQSACQSENTKGTPGLVGALGLGSNNPNTDVSCTPNVAISGH